MILSIKNAFFFLYLKLKITFYLNCSKLPVNIAPFGILAPRSIYCCGFFKKFTNSIISILASSHPATSLMCNEIYINEPEMINNLYNDKIYLLLT